MATNTLTVSRFNSALKVWFPEKKFQTYKMDEQPFWNYIPKGERFPGRSLEIPFQFSVGGGGNSHQFADAQESKGSARYTHFTVTRRRDYKIISLEIEAIEASEGDDGAYMKATVAEIEAAQAHIVQQLGADLQGNGSGHIGAVTAAPVGNTFTVGDNEIVHFEPDMRLQSAASPFTALRPGVVGYMVVLSVNYDTNTVTVDPAAGDSVAAYGLTSADRVYPKGNFGLSLEGTEAWVPTDRSNLAVAFNGVDRSVFPSRLAGIFFDASTYGLLEGFERAAARAAKEHTKPDTWWVNYNRFADLSLELGAKAIREPVKLGEFAYDSIVQNLSGKKTRFMCDPNLPDTTALGTTKESWKFRSLKGVPRFLTKDLGSQMIIEPAGDALECRIGWRGNLTCNNPGANVRVTLPV